MNTNQVDLITLQAMPTGGGSDKTLKKNIQSFNQEDPACIELETHTFPLLVNRIKRQFATTQKNKNLLNTLREDAQKMGRQLAHLQK